MVEEKQSGYSRKEVGWLLSHRPAAATQGRRPHRAASRLPRARPCPGPAPAPGPPPPWARLLSRGPAPTPPLPGHATPSPSLQTQAPSMGEQARALWQEQRAEQLTP